MAILAVTVVGPAGAATDLASAKVQLSFLDNTSNKVGTGSQGTPGTSPTNGHFQLAVTAHDTVTTVTLKAADAKWQPCCRQGWNTQPRDGWWILGVFRGRTRLNPVDKNISDPVAGSVTYDIYAADSGYFKRGQNFVVYVNFASGSCVSARTEIGGPSSAGGSCPTLQIGPPTAGGWSANAASLRGQNGSRFTVVCPAKGTPVAVWGTNTYSDNSSICTAAVHVGLITLASGGTVAIEIRPGRSSYPSFTHNGITPLVGGSWPGSFRFPTAAPIPGTLTKVKQGVIQVSDFPKRTLVTVRAGKRYLAKP